ncbi:MAG: DUF2924 domain-containing protein [Magnetococcales bacterium]|nr:DUF2924 domain-containing protein [Magnetococcales bacterium]
MNIDVIKRVTALPGMSTQELRRMWREVNNTDPPPYNKTFLVRRLTYRLQELVYGGLPSSCLKRLESIANQEDKSPNMIAKSVGYEPVAGTRLLREWKGVEHCVTVMEDGFEYQGRRFKSLSSVARAITGTQWNGRIFFYGNRAKRGGK